MRYAGKLVELTQGKDAIKLASVVDVIRKMRDAPKLDELDKLILQQARFCRRPILKRQ